MRVEQIFDKINDFNTKTEIVTILIVSIMSGIAGYINELVEYEKKFKKLVFISTILNSMIAGAIVGSLLDLIPIFIEYPKIKYALISASTFSASLIMKHITKGMVDLIPELFNRLKLALHLVISPDAAYTQYKRNEVSAPTTPTTPTNSTVKIEQSRVEPIKEDSVTKIDEPVQPVKPKIDKDKLEEARKKLGLPPKA